MDCYQTSKAQVVVKIKEGNGFTFLTNPVVVVASLNGIKLETKEILPSNCPQFDSELIWQADTKYLRRLRISNTSLKLECFTFINYHKQNSRRNRIGYILINLKEAQIINHGEAATVPDSWHRLLGLKNLYQAHKPELLLKFIIEEAFEMMKPNSNEENTDEKANINTNLGMGDGNGIGILTNQVQDSLQIGPPHLCTELYELSINIISVGHIANIMAKEKVDVPIKAHFVIFGYSFVTKDLSVFRENMNYGRMSLKIWSQLQFICAYFKEFSNLVITIYSDEDIVGTGLMDLQVLGNLSTKRNITINDTVHINSAIVEEKEKLSLEVGYPFLEMEVQLIHKKDCISTKIDQETQSNYEYSPERYESGDPPYTSNPLLSHNESSTINYKNVKEIRSIETIPVYQDNVKLKGENSFISKPNMEINEHPEFLSTSPVAPLFHDLPTLPDAKEHSKILIKGATIRACEELEEWKEKQQEMFKFELKKKTDRHLKKLSNEWLKKKYELEDDLKKRIEECQVLKEKLIIALEDLTQRSELLTVKEEELKIATEELDKKYTMKFQELRKASKLHEYDMEDKIHEMAAEKTELYKKLEDSRKEILRLQDALLSQDTPHQLSKDQTATLINEIKDLEQKLEKAVESKTFFKEQWGKAVRELHRMKEEEQQHLRWQIQKNRQELQTLGLVKEISQEVGEMKKDQSSIKNIRNELANFISASNDPLMDHFQNTY